VVPFKDLIGDADIYGFIPEIEIQLLGMRTYAVPQFIQPGIQTKYAWHGRHSALKEPRLYHVKLRSR
jgi:hypothetical protein